MPLAALMSPEEATAALLPKSSKHRRIRNNRGLTEEVLKQCTCNAEARSPHSPHHHDTSEMTAPWPGMHGKRSSWGSENVELAATSVGRTRGDSSSTKMVSGSTKAYGTRATGRSSRPPKARSPSRTIALVGNTQVRPGRCPNPRGRRPAGDRIRGARGSRPRISKNGRLGAAVRRSCSILRNCSAQKIA